MGSASSVSPQHSARQQLLPLLQTSPISSPPREELVMSSGLCMLPLRSPVVAPPLATALTPATRQTLRNRPATLPIAFAARGRSSVSRSFRTVPTQPAPAHTEPASPSPPPEPPPPGSQATFSFSSLQDALEAPDKVLALSVQGQNLVTVPPCVCAFLFIKRLDLRRNQLTRLPEPFKYLTNLRRLDVGCNRLILFAEMAKIRHLVSLRRLTWDENAVEEIPASGWGSLGALRILNLATNSIATLPPSSSDFYRITSLTNLNVSHNRIVSLPSDLGKLSLLKRLALRDNKISDIPPALCLLSHLLSLDLIGNPLQRIPEAITSLTSATQLGFSMAPDSSEPAVISVGKISWLEELTLTGSTISVVPPSFSELKSLQFLSLYGNQLNDLPSTLSMLTNLHNLVLGHNKFTALPHVVFTITSLRQLTFSNDDFLSPKAGMLCNAVHSISSELGMLLNLQTLICNFNPIREVPNAVTALTNLHTIHAHNCDLQYGAQWLRPVLSLSTLTSLDLGSAPGVLSNQLGSFPEADLPPKLAELRIQGNGLMYVPWESLLKLECLRVLDLSSNKILSIHPGISSLTSLLELNLSDNRLREIPNTLGTLRSLTSLSLGQNALQTIPRELASLPNLTKLSLSQNSFPHEEVIALKSLFAHVSLELGQSSALEAAPETDVQTRKWVLKRTDRFRSSSNPPPPIT